MNKKYKITQTNALFTFAIKVQNIETGLIDDLICHVDYQNDEIYFENDLQQKYDLEELKSLLMKQVKPAAVEIPMMPPEAYHKINEIKNANMQQNYKDFS
jgi:hypothetical protein